ncbi:hypothetical protein [Bacillus safensis]|uniref:hypothetical protein n=1 Tax=Bacillus safensis TaxID=561879 RepID=UPI00148EACC5|nr:hypothetical protein [Bacillus safensis]NOL36782.1 hypothetical protein [Bacillus safensis]
MTEPNTQWFRWTHRHALNNNYITGFPTFHVNSKLKNEYFDYWKICKFNGGLESTSVSATALNNVDPENVRESVKEVNLYAKKRSEKYIGGFPTFEKWMRDEGGEHRGINYVLRDSAEYERIYIEEFAEIGYKREILYDTELQYKAVHDYAVNKGYVTGMPTFTEEGDFIGVLLFKGGVEIEEMPFLFFNIQENNYDHFDMKRFPETMRAFELAISKFSECGYLNNEEKKGLVSGFGKRKFIMDMPDEKKHPSEEVTNRAIAEWGDGDFRLLINWDVFVVNDKVDVELLAESLIHEIMHIGLEKDHDIKYDPSFDKENYGCGDERNHAYFKDPMNRAECCIRNHLGLKSHH